MNLDIDFRALWNTPTKTILSAQVDNIEFQLTLKNDSYCENEDVVAIALEDEVTQWREFHDELPYKDQVEKIGDIYNIRNDSAIVFFHDAIQGNIDVRNIIHVDCGNFFWGIHDLYHAINDVDAYQVYTDANIELDRHVNTLEWFVKLDKLEIPHSLLEEASDWYLSRFKKSIDLNELYFDLKSYPEIEEDA